MQQNCDFLNSRSNSSSRKFINFFFFHFFCGWMERNCRQKWETAKTVCWTKLLISNVHRGIFTSWYWISQTIIISILICCNKIRIRMKIWMGKLDIYMDACCMQCTRGHRQRNISGCSKMWRALNFGGKVISNKSAT